MHGCRLGIGLAFVGLLVACSAASETPAPSSSPTPSNLRSATASAGPTVGSPTRTAAPTDSADIDIAWTAQTIAGEFRDVFADGDRFIAVGQVDGAQAAWVSADGVDWVRHEVPPPADVKLSPETGITQDYVASGSRMGTLVRLDDTVYSFGFFNIMDFLRPVGWRWTDGTAWEPITSASPFFEAGSVADAVAGDGVLVAARSDIALSEFGADTEVWIWKAPTSWVQSDLSVAEPERVVVNRLAWNDGVFLAAGAIVPEPGPEAVWIPRMWQSAEGQAWREVAPPSEDATVCALAADPAGGFVAVSMTAEEAVVWRGRGGDWSGTALADVPNPDRSWSPFTTSCGVVPLGDDIVVILAGNNDTRVWWSRNGGAWMGGEAVSPARSFNPIHAAGFGSILVVAHIETDPTGGRAQTVVHTASIP